MFFIVLFFAYYLCPKRFQWTVLLAGSLFFYACTGVRNLIYVLLTSATAYAATGWMDRSLKEQKRYIEENKAALSRDEKKAFKKRQQGRRKLVLALTLLFNFGLLSYFKYVHFLIDQVNALFGAFGGPVLPNAFSLIVPLGISFYTFQTMGYVVDVYWEEQTAEKNYLKVLLFTSFFPQMTQGPISNFAQLQGELFKEHRFTARHYIWGFRRALWGFYKKLVVADMISPIVGDIFQNYLSYSGFTALLGALLYSVQIYADFSGYMDIVCGLCEMLDIRLAENFERPYFSKSIAEYWRRWHITLGAWFKTYVYYPVAASRWNAKLSKRFGKSAGMISASVALVVVWLTTGLWHGASWAYIAWGGVNGLFIIFSLWMEPVYKAAREKLHINETNVLWRAFQIVRTFLLVTFIKVLPEVGTLGQGAGLIAHIFREHTVPRKVFDCLPYLNTMVYQIGRKGIAMLFPFMFGAQILCMIALGILLMFTASVLQTKKPVRAYVDAIPAVVRVPLIALFILLTIYYGIPVSSGIAFMYAQF